MEYIEGESLSQAIKRISAAAPQETIEAELTLIAKAGEIIAQVHSHNIVLGDTKPENMLVKPDNTIYLIDFEQAAQDSNGDKTWDVAVFLYYAGHYIPRNGNIKAEVIAKAFINGYLKASGDVNTIKRAGDQKYTRVFGIFTRRSIISVISNICRKTEAPEGK
jgi:tRNA A-37 threonylcarbamoyl transferase component Bud32